MSCPGGRFLEDGSGDHTAHDNVDDCTFCNPGRYLRNRTAHAWFCGDLLLGQSGLRDDSENMRRANLSGWTLVRALAPGGNRGHAATDDLAGTDTYGDANVTAAVRGTWSVNFEEALPGYDMLMFMLGGMGGMEQEDVQGCGQKWVVLAKEELGKKSSSGAGATMEATRTIEALRSSASKLAVEYATNMNNPDWGSTVAASSGERSVHPVIHAKLGNRAGADWQDSDTVYLEGGQPAAVGTYVNGVWQPGAGDVLAANIAAGMYVFVGRRRSGSSSETKASASDWWCYPEEPTTGERKGSATSPHNIDSAGTASGRQNTCSISVHVGTLLTTSQKTVIVPVPAFFNASVGRDGADPAWRRELYCSNGGYGWSGGDSKTHGFIFTSVLHGSSDSSGNPLLAAATHWTVHAVRKGAIPTWSDVDLHVLCSVRDVRLYADHDSAATDCLVCPAGRFETGPQTKHVCDACASGRYSTSMEGATATSCLACPLGMWQSKASATACLNCSVGRYGYRSGMAVEWLAYEMSDVGCAMCQTGFWQDTAGAQACKSCPAGFVGASPRPPAASTVSDAVGFTSPAETCSRCSRGFFIAEEDTAGRVLVCEACPPGFYSGVEGAVSATESCVPCPAGKHACGEGPRDSRDSACCECGQGRYQDEATGGKLSCKSCQKGRYSIAFGATVSCAACGLGMYGDELGAGSAGAVKTVTLPPPPDRAETVYNPLPSQSAPGAVPGLYTKYLDMWCEENGEGGPGFVEAGIGAEIVGNTSSGRTLNFTMISLATQEDHWGARGPGRCIGWTGQKPGAAHTVDAESGQVPASATISQPYSIVESVAVCNSLCLEDVWCRFASFRSADGRCTANRGGLSGFVGVGHHPDAFFDNTGTNHDRVECVRNNPATDEAANEWETFQKIQTGVLNVGDKYKRVTTRECLNLCNARAWCRSVIVTASVELASSPVPWSCQLTARCTVKAAIGVKWRNEAPEHYPLSNDGVRHDFFGNDWRVWMYVKDDAFYASQSTRKVFHGKPSDFALAPSNPNALARMAAFDVEVRPSLIDGAPYVHSVNATLGGSGYSLAGHEADGGITFLAKPSLFASKGGAKEATRWEGLLEYPETWVGVEDVIEMSVLERTVFSRARHGVFEPTLSAASLFSPGDTIVTYPHGVAVGVVSETVLQSYDGLGFVKNASACAARATGGSLSTGQWPYIPYGCTMKNGQAYWNDNVFGKSHHQYTRVGMSTGSITMRPPGTFLSLPDDTLVTRAFTFRVSAIQTFSGCKACEKGRYNDQQRQLQQQASGSVEVNESTTEFFLASAYNDCKLCPKGRWDNEEGMKSAEAALDGCNACLPGQYGTEEGCINPSGTLTEPSLVATNRDGLGSWSCLHACAFCPSGYFSGAHGMASNATCQACPPGMFVDKAGAIHAGECQKCPAGKFGTSPGTRPQHPCTDCPVGRFVATAGTMGASNCSLCEAGTFGPKTGSSERDDCELCPRGRYSSVVGRFREDQCLRCPGGRVGKFRGLIARGREDVNFTQANVTSDPYLHCVGCAPGFFQAVPGSSECAPVAPGHFTSDPDAMVELPCSKGRFSVAGVKDRCETCPKGRYNELLRQAGVDRCLPCDEGKFLDATAATSRDDCEACAVGYYTPTTGNTEISDCRACASGQFQDEAGAVRCHDCQRGKAQEAEGAVGCDDCSPGTYQSNLKSSTCTSCEPGRFQTDTGQETCSLCPDGWFQSDPAQGNCSMCAVGFFMGCPGGSQCWECEIGRTSEPAEGGTQCVAETLPTVEPLVISPGTGGVYSPGAHPQDEPSVGCLDFRIPDADERATLDASLPYRFSNGFMIEWSVERSFPPPNEDAPDERLKTNTTMFYPESYGDLGKYPLHALLQARGLDQTPVDKVHGPWSICVNTTTPLHLEELFMRVRGIGPILQGQQAQQLQPQDDDTAEVQSTALGTPSQTTPGFVTALECGNVMYLTQSSYPPTGKGGWTVGAYNSDTGNWRCEPCPVGADCRGDTRWVDIYAKFGYFRLDSHDFDRRETSFWQCFKPLACLGGKNPLLERKYVWLSERQTRPAWPNVTVDGRQVDVQPPEDRGELPICCTALDPLFDDVPACKDAPPGNGPGTPCNVDLAKVDDFEGCNDEAGYALDCPNSPTGKCRLCRKCSAGWWEQGVSTCLRCPPMWVNIMAPIFAGGLIAAMMFVFLSSALNDSSAEAHSSVVHLSQPMQKILLNHAQLVSLASGFPLAWPDAVQEMFTAMGVLGQAGSYMFNPACNGVELVEGESMFFQKQLGILMLPFFAVACSVLFWLGVACQTCVLDMYEHPDDRHARLERKKKERAAAAKKLEEEKKQSRAQKKIEKKKESERRKLVKLERKASVRALKLEKKNMKLALKAVVKEGQTKNKGEEEKGKEKTALSTVSSVTEGKKAHAKKNASKSRMAPPVTGKGNSEKKILTKVKGATKPPTASTPAIPPPTKLTPKPQHSHASGLLHQIGDKLVSVEHAVESAVHRTEDVLDSMLHLTSHRHRKISEDERKSLSETIHDEMRANAEAAKALVTFRDKCIATIVTVLYLIYPTVVKSTFLLVACAPVGKNFYLQMDLDIECYRSEHMFWVLHLFLPCFLGYVIGLPLIAYLILFCNKHKLNDRTIRFRYGTLFTGYTDACYYWEGVVAMRKAAVLAISVFLTNAGAEAQALSAVMVIMLSLIVHLHWTPFVRVDETHNTLFWSEFCALFVAFVTFWTGLFFFQEVAKEGAIQQAFTFELLTLNAVFCVMAMRWFLILKLMDIDDQIQIDELKGEDEKKIKKAKKLRTCLKRVVPEWRKLSQLWTKRAWKVLIRKQILKNRAMRLFTISDLAQQQKHQPSRRQSQQQQQAQAAADRKRYGLSEGHQLHEIALANLFATSDPTPMVQRIASTKGARKKTTRRKSWSASLAESIMAKKKSEAMDTVVGMMKNKTKVAPVVGSGGGDDENSAAVQKAKERFLWAKQKRREKRRRKSKERAVVVSAPGDRTMVESGDLKGDGGGGGGKEVRGMEAMGRSKVEGAAFPASSVPASSVLTAPVPDRAASTAKLKRRRKKKKKKKKALVPPEEDMTILPEPTTPDPAVGAPMLPPSKKKDKPLPKRPSATLPSSSAKTEADLTEAATSPAVPARAKRRKSRAEPALPGKPAAIDPTATAGKEELVDSDMPQ
jgi:hypothetical protein